MAEDSKKALGKVVQIDEKRIKECLAVLAKRGGGEGSLGQVLVEKGYITPAQYRAIQAHVQKLSPNGQGRATAKSPERAAASKGRRAAWAALYVLSVAAMLTTHYLAFLRLAA